jgi:hypothetical protein
LTEYHFRVSKEVVEDRALFRFSLSRGNIDFLLQCCPELECISGACGRMIFRIYSDGLNGLPDRFIAKSDDEYHANLDVFLGKSVRNRTSEQIETDLVDAINASERIPIIMETGCPGGINLGYVLMRVES